MTLFICSPFDFNVVKIVKNGVSRSSGAIAKHPLGSLTKPFQKGPLSGDLSFMVTDSDCESPTCVGY